MEKLTNKKSFLDTIRFSEGTEFECDENAILKEYEVNHENTSSLAIKILSIFVYLNNVYNYLHIVSFIIL